MICGGNGASPGAHLGAVVDDDATLLSSVMMMIEIDDCYLSFLPTDVRPVCMYVGM